MANITYFGENRLNDLLSKLSTELSNKDAFLVTFTEASDGTWSADKTWTEIDKAYAANRLCLGRVSDSTEDFYPYYLMEAEGSNYQYQFINLYFTSPTASEGSYHQKLIADTFVYTSTSGHGLKRKTRNIPFLEGATFTGSLTLAGDPTSDLQAATKQYVDNKSVFVATYMSTTFAEVDAAYNAGKTCICKQGGRTGHIFSRGTIAGSKCYCFALLAYNTTSINSSPMAIFQKINEDDTWETSNTILADTDYVVSKTPFIATYGTTTNAEIKAAYDAGKICFCKDSSMRMIPLFLTTSGQSIFGAVSSNATTMVYKVTSSNEWSTESYSMVPVTGGTFTGAITLAGDPTSNLHAATKQYVDNAIGAAISASY